jgi:hypothetical protein
VAVDQQRSEAVILFLGKGLNPWLKRKPERLTERFGEEIGLDLVQYVQTVLDELYGVQPDWSGGGDDLVSGTNKAVDRVRENHPELSEEALAALGWSFSYDWK